MCPPFGKFFNVGLKGYLRYKTILCHKVALKGCVHHIFASLFFSLNESTCQTRKNVFLFHLKSSFSSRENQILTFYVFEFCDVIKCLSIKQEIHFTE